MVIEVTKQDIEHAGHKAVNNPITRALKRATNRQWVIFDGRMAYELTPPYWSLNLPEHVIRFWQEYQKSGKLQPFSFELHTIQDHIIGNPPANSTPIAPSHPQPEPRSNSGHMSNDGSHSPVHQSFTLDNISLDDISKAASHHSATISSNSFRSVGIERRFEQRRKAERRKFERRQEERHPAQRTQW